MSSINGARAWVNAGLSALDIKTDDTSAEIRSIFHRHLHGTKTESVNLQKLINQLPAGTIASLREKFPQISGNHKSDVHFFYAAMRSTLDEKERAAATFSHGRVLSLSIPKKLAATFQQPATGAPIASDLMTKLIDDPKLENGNARNIFANSASLTKSTTIPTVPPKTAHKTSKSPPKAETPRSNPMQDLARSQPIVRPREVEGSALSSPVSARPRSLSVRPQFATASAAMSAENRQKLVNATRLDLTAVRSDGTFIFQDQNKSEISTKDISFLSECKNLNTLNLKNARDVTQIDLSACTKLQHLNLGGCSALTKVILPPGGGAMNANGSIYADRCPAFPNGMDIKRLQSENSGKTGPIVFEKKQPNTNLNVTKTAAPVELSGEEKKLLAATRLEFTGIQNGKYIFNTGSGTVEVSDLSILTKCKNLEKLVINEPIPTLKSLDLSGCQNLQHFECRWCDNLSEIRFHPRAVMQSVYLQDCKNLRNITLPIGNTLRNFEGDGCPALANIRNAQVGIIANEVAKDSALGDPANSDRRKNEIFSGAEGLRITCNDDGTTTFSAPEPKKRSFFSRRK
ncbi:MAG: hypothetical protein LBF26_01160 [Puniceicoccales bacterium]|jgi:hypothetical protein|nr:hypothetical protein [Puniceicoccales bacterium]